MIRRLYCIPISHPKLIHLLSLLALSAHRPAFAGFSADFNNFLDNSFGVGVRQELERSSLGPAASFGGKTSADVKFDSHAVVLVHGITNTANRFLGTAHAFESNGYKKGQVFATTWGDGGKTPLFLVDLKCRYVKQVRNMITAVRAYTGRKVDIIAYSMGAPLARKAILGGHCVENRDNLGPSITSFVDTFVSVAGANHGSSLCFYPIPVGSCNKRTGLHCTSEFLRDINRVASHKYEGNFVFTIFSPQDGKVGYKNCNKVTAAIPSQDRQFIKHGLNHDQVMDTTRDLQRTLVLQHKP